MSSLWQLRALRRVLRGNAALDIRAAVHILPPRARLYLRDRGPGAWSYFWTRFCVCAFLGLVWFWGLGFRFGQIPGVGVAVRTNTSILTILTYCLTSNYDGIRAHDNTNNTAATNINRVQTGIYHSNRGRCNLLAFGAGCLECTVSRLTRGTSTSSRIT